MPTPATVICLTPVRNEASVLEHFLNSASTWADRIVVADQGSSDGSREIAGRFPKVTLVDNPSGRYDEVARQRLLIEEARRTPGRRLIVALDADEGLTWGSWATSEWDELRRAHEGTTAFFDWVNLLPGLADCWIPRERVPFAFVDDGRPHHGAAIHNARVPVSERPPPLVLDAVKVLHFQYVDWARMKSKQRWYQCWEALHHPKKRPIQLYRQYHRMDAFPPAEIHPVNPDWVRGHADQAENHRPADSPQVFHWDKDVLGWLLERGPKRFRRLDIWDVDWEEVAAHVARPVVPGSLADPRSRTERTVHRWLRRTQGRSDRRTTRLLQRALIPLGW
jgi:hypothetical protein